ncbi:MAG: gfo/Idh/MocA family oxidoreductase [Puniceicoccaceae bacterium]|nr:MAG: gfo/Idh/MocA family oxidoreductase [Puniceicoccaceae bacterium]
MAKSSPRSTAPAPVRIGIIGMGIGRENARGFLADPRARITALCDLDPARMQDFAKELPETPQFFTDHRAICRAAEVDAVFVGTPNQYHVPVALEAVRNGKHVMVTKPLADSVAAGKRLVEAAEAAGVVNMMSLSTRFSPGCRHLGNIREEGFFGDLYYARARSIRRSGIPAWNLGFITPGGGAFRDMGVHVLDAAWWLLGRPRPTTVAGVAGARFGPRGQGYWGFSPVAPEIAAKFDTDDYAGGFIRFENGTGLQVESFWASHQPEELQVELFGSEGGARMAPPTLYRTVAGAPHDTAVTLPKSLPGPWAAMARHFLDCILGKATCEAPLRDGLAVQIMMEGLLKSAANGKEVRFPRI